MYTLNIYIYGVYMCIMYVTHSIGMNEYCLYNLFSLLLGRGLVWNPKWGWDLIRVVSVEVGSTAHPLMPP